MSFQSLLWLVECKQVTDKDRISVSRLKQTIPMLSFSHAQANHKAFYLINFWKGRADKSACFMIPVEKLDNYIHSFNLLSLTLIELEREFPFYKFDLDGKFWDIGKYINKIVSY